MHIADYTTFKLSCGSLVEGLTEGGSQPFLEAAINTYHDNKQKVRPIFLFLEDNV